jgi:hypothetical protein
LGVTSLGVSDAPGICTLRSYYELLVLVQGEELNSNAPLHLANTEHNPGGVKGSHFLLLKQFWSSLACLPAKLSSYKANVSENVQENESTAPLVTLILEALTYLFKKRTISYEGIFKDPFCVKNTTRKEV